MNYLGYCEWSDEMDLVRYKQYLKQYIVEALQQSDGSTRGIAEHLSMIQIKGLLVMHREEKKRALADARQAFDEHRHWPLEIILKHLGVVLD
jgi:hypothetical protein